MSDPSHSKHSPLALKSRLIPKFEWISYQNSISVRNQHKPDNIGNSFSPVFRSKRHHKLTTNGKSSRRPEISPYNVHELRLSLNKDNRQAWNDRLLDNFRREVSPQSEIRTSVTKSKNSLRLPVIKLLNKAIMKKAQEKQPTSLETSFILHEKEKERSSKIYKRVESFQRKDENRNRRSDAKENPLSKTIDVCNEPGEDEEKETNIKNVHRARPVTVHKKREPVKILLQNEIEIEKPKEVIPIQEEKVEKGQGNREWRRVSHMTLTSAYNSNESLIDYRDGNWDNEEDSEKRIKEIVEKHVEDAYKSIDIIKRNFQTKSKTYLFHIDRDSCE